MIRRPPRSTPFPSTTLFRSNAGTAANYDTTSATGTLTVSKAAALTVTANDKSKVYGADEPTLSYEVPRTALYSHSAHALRILVALSTATGAAATAGTHTIFV